MRVCAGIVAASGLKDAYGYRDADWGHRRFSDADAGDVNWRGGHERLPECASAVASAASPPRAVQDSQQDELRRPSTVLASSKLTVGAEEQHSQSYQPSPSRGKVAEAAPIDRSVPSSVPDGADGEFSIRLTVLVVDCIASSCSCCNVVQRYS